jgi:hypothetical protein
MPRDPDDARWVFVVDAEDEGVPDQQLDAAVAELLLALIEEEDSGTAQ